MAPTDAGTIERSDSASSINKEKELISTQTRDTTQHHIADVEYVGKAGHAATDEYGNPIVEIDALVAKRVVRKFDLRLVPPLALLYLFCFIDRANIGNARVAGLPQSLGLDTFGYNLLLFIFYIAYAVSEPFLLAVVKIYGPHIVLPSAGLLFGLATMCFAFVQSFGGAVPLRILLGLAEAPIIGGIAVYFSRYYTVDELALRLAGYIVMAPLAGAFGGLLASGILTSERMGSVYGWRQIFLIEGIISMVVAGALFFLLPKDVAGCKFLTEEEKLVATARIKRENIGQTEVVDKMDFKHFFGAMRNPITVLCCLIFFFDNILAQSLGFFTPTVLRALFPGRSTIDIQLLSVGPYMVGAVGVMLSAWLSSRFRVRAPLFVASGLGTVVGYAIFVANTSAAARYAAIFIAMPFVFALGALCNAWACANVTSDTQRAGAIALVVFGGNLGGVVSTWAYVPADAPLYKGANTAMMTFGIAIFALTLVTIWYIRTQNKRRDEGSYQVQGFAEMSNEERNKLGIRHPAFRFRY